MDAAMAGTADRSAARRIAVVHYGEGAEPDPGHRSHRAGRLAAALVRDGCDVARIVPSFRQWEGTQRPTTWTGTVGAEGRLVVVPTRAFSNTRGRDRAGSLMDFNRGVRRFFDQDPDYDLVITGFPPPGLLRAVAKTAPKAATIADIRDLWPDALVPQGRVGSAAAPLARMMGRGLARELRLADAVVALSPTMLRRAPAQVTRTAMIPIGFEPAGRESERQWPSKGDPMTACFVGSMTQLFDLRSMLLGWKRFIATRDPLGPSPELVVVGDGEQRAMVDEVVGRDPTVRVTGWVLGGEVAGYLGRSDLGLAPTRRGQGTTVSNKVSEYMADGLLVLNTLTPEVAEPLEQLGLGRRVESTPEAWSAGFRSVEAGLGRLRTTRRRRIDEADRHFGGQLTDRLWFELIDEILASRPVAHPAR